MVFRCISALMLSVGMVCYGGLPTISAEPSYQDDAVASACDTLEGRGDIISALQHGQDTEDTNRLVLENTADWVPRFNAFAKSEAAVALRSYAEGAFAATEGGEYSERVCSVLKPALAVAQSGQTVLGAGGAIEPGILLDRCSEGLCVPEALDVVADKCTFEVFALPVTNPCGDGR